jgi:hypothetical protein
MNGGCGTAALRGAVPPDRRGRRAIITTKTGGGDADRHGAVAPSHFYCGTQMLSDCTSSVPGGS